MIRNVLNFKYRWLILAGLVTACQSTTPPEKADLTLFKRIPGDKSGIQFTNKVEERFENFFDFFAYVYNGGGVAIGDINNDGLPDIYFTGNEVPNKLYLNEGNLKFKDITESAGVTGGDGWHNGVSLVDINADGWMDIYICRGGWQDTEAQRANLLYINQGNLNFREEAAAYGLNDTGYSVHATFFDMDNDLDLDVYVMNRPDSFYLPLSTMVSRHENPPAHSRDKLFVNENGKFTERGQAAGLGHNYGYGLSVVAADLNQDGWTDLFVSNDYSVKDYLYINQKDGTFREQIRDATNHISLYSMGADVADLNNDGLEDLIVMEMRPEDYKRSKVSMPSMNVQGFYAIVDAGQHKQYMHNMLHLNQGNLFFSEISQLAGVSKTDWSWSVLASDFDNDGSRDLLVTNGMRRDLFDGDVQMRLTKYVNENRDRFKTQEDLFGEGFDGIINSYRPVKVNNYLYRYTGDYRYENVSAKWGITEPTFSHGAAVADLDGDGDLDLVINNLEDEAFLYENTTNSSANYLKVQLAGPATNPTGLGAKITLFTSSGQQFFEQKTVRGYLSSNDPIIHFGLGSLTTVDSIRVRWNDGKVSKAGSLSANQMVKMTYANAATLVPDTLQKMLFTTAKAPDFVHQENTFDEYRKQILLPHMFSKNGPFISTGDADGSGQADFYVGGAAGQPGQLFLGKADGFNPKKVQAFEEDKAFEDMQSVWVDVDNDGDQDLVVVSGGSEFEEGHALYQTRLYVNDGRANFTRAAFPKTGSSGSTIAAHDFDGDGDTDLFIGGQVLADQYPLPPQSHLMVNTGGKFEDQTASLAPALERIGMVNDATWTDVTGDGQKELILVGEWLDVTVMQWNGSTFDNRTESLGLVKTAGWWNTVQAADLDGDGDQDLVLGNLGENYKFQASAKKPLKVFANDFDLNGTNDVFLAKYNEDSLVPIRGRECSSQQVPLISRKFPSYEAFANASIEDILGPALERSFKREAYLFSSVIAENTRQGFVLKKLPAEAQFSAITTVQVADFNADGVPDLLVAGNKFDSEVETTPADASPGYLLLGKGQLQYEAVPPHRSGFYAQYNVKDMVLLAKKNGWQVLVASNNDSLRMYEYVPKKPSIP